MSTNNPDTNTGRTGFQNAEDAEGDGPEDSFIVIPSDPEAGLGFEIEPHDTDWTFAPNYYPETLTQVKSRELKRDGQQCGGEDVSVENVKNREIHVSGSVLAMNVTAVQDLADFDGLVDLLSPLTPYGGLECQLKEVELGTRTGWDPMTRQWRFEYTIDLVSTGRDEHSDQQNAIVSDIIETVNESN